MGIAEEYAYHKYVSMKNTLQERAHMCKSLC